MCTLVSKYNTAGPRYTSYPTVPYWDINSFKLSYWKNTLIKSFNESNFNEGISLYIHLPFCESMCTFCGCNKRITKNHAVELPYIQSVLKEFKMYVSSIGKLPTISQIHLGGGTPTFFSPEHLTLLVNGIFTVAKKGVHMECSFEGHPNNTTKAHLDALNALGFKSICFGVQDYNPKVQKAINRVQSFETVSKATDAARRAGYTSVGHDIIYGLPHQLKYDVINTVNKTIALNPDRIAFYSYAHVPWMKGNGQRGFKDEDLPSAELKKEQYTVGKNMLLNAGYKSIGLDHFALPTDALYKAKQEGTLHRNFMGYTPKKTKLMIGLGVSAISDSWYGFSQNTKNLDDYLSLIHQDILPLQKGHILNKEDLIIRKHILNLMCTFETSWENCTDVFPELHTVVSELTALEQDGLINIYPNRIEVTEIGKLFIRNICSFFDMRLKRKRPESALFSMTV